mgnify:CR=1 FL=1
MKNEIKNQPVIREQSYRILVDKPLLDFLRPRTEGKFSKLDAYCFLLDKAVAESDNPIDEPFGNGIVIKSPHNKLYRARMNCIIPP